MKKIAVFTGTRADYGLLYYLLKGIEKDPDLTLQLIVSGGHLSPEFGDTWKSIVRDGFSIDARVEMLLSSDTSVGIAKSMGIGIVGFADALNRLSPDCLVILGDRFETLAIAQTALVMSIPMCHIHGGELTQGAYDDSIRHALTKMATWHFVATDTYRNRVIQLGEAPERVFNVGAVGLDHITQTPLLSQSELSESLGGTLSSPYFLVTYHPVTSGEEDSITAFRNVLEVLDNYPQHQVLLTYPNADNGGRALIKMIETCQAQNPTKVVAVKSLGTLRYLSAVRHAQVVIGNSSSGITEVPTLKVPTLNIGSRQLGRISASSVLHCDISYDAIDSGLKTALSDDFRQQCRQTVNPYGQGQASDAIIKVLKTKDLISTKAFYDLKFET
ncbi:UDP-N-acetylglucosamine 2-epimerase [Lacimicrobium alkaliphilum]|uniref:UDP-N-acetyl glucosamine 2-epimerase n=1 Tax=Lacimicrobium alkaliphilum TaxID=1526571 RepID=A0ABQ1RLR4_9ALTE|nr:UDP-N-acetylglucosamine 2-epimerase [Lacimicrobium alkaliphilum]GGD72556.1 UDP-N-acetyl glucosamine 2-epimerase [Lacimicrobium alkaliphilum]